MKTIDYVYRMAKNKAVLSGIMAVMVCGILALPARAEKISLTELDHECAVEMKTGDKLEITLDGNPTTGYIWEKVEGDTATLAQQGDYKYTPAKPLLVGSGGNFVFSFQGATSGKTKLRFIYHRTFEKNVAPVKSFEVMVIVK